MKPFFIYLNIPPSWNIPCSPVKVFPLEKISPWDVPCQPTTVKDSFQKKSPPECTPFTSQRISFGKKSLTHRMCPAHSTDAVLILIVD